MAPEPSTLFHSDQRLCFAEILSSREVLARIDVIVLRFLKSLVSSDPSISDLSMIRRTKTNTNLRQGCFSDCDSIFLSSNTYNRSFMHSSMGKTFVRVWKVLEICSTLLRQGKQATQREIFYKLLCDSPKYFRVQEDVNRAIQDVVALVQCSRHSLGIMASSRGAVIGRLLIHEPNGNEVDCSFLSTTGHVINGNLNVLKNWIFKSDSRYIILVEKAQASFSVLYSLTTLMTVFSTVVVAFRTLSLSLSLSMLYSLTKLITYFHLLWLWKFQDAIFQRLAEDRIFNHIPSILITAKGYPDLASRFFLHQLRKSFPGLRIFALVDWNPAGLAIICTYKFGSITMGLEASSYVCDVKWLGLRKEDLKLVPECAKLDLKPKDHQIAQSLLCSKMLQNQMEYKNELLHMVNLGHRVEIEALYAHGYDFLAKYITKKFVQHDYI